MLKHLIEKGYINVNKMLLENYPQLGLNEKELVVLLKLFEMLKNTQAYVSVANLAKKTSMNQNECSEICDGLFNRGLLGIDLEYTKQGKARETFNLDEFIKYLESFFNSEITQEEIADNEDKIREITSLVEETFKRSLTPLELQIIVEWQKNGENIQKIRQALAMSVKAAKMSLKYVDSCLIALNNTVEEKALDEKQSKLLDDFYRNIR